jgi:ribosome-associated translation inhibitor RaiA
MHHPLQITFHQLPASEALEADVRGRVAELETVYDRITSCRVVIDVPHRHHQQGRLFRVGIDLGVPGGHIVVGRASDSDAAHEDPYVAVRDAFRAARRQLEDHVQRQRGDVKSHALAPGVASER